MIICPCSSRSGSWRRVKSLCQSPFVCMVHSRSHFLDRHISGGTSSVSAKMVFHEVSPNTFNSAGLRATCSLISVFNTFMNVRINLRKLLLRHPIFMLATLESNRASRVPRCPSRKPPSSRERCTARCWPWRRGQQGLPIPMFVLLRAFSQLQRRTSRCTTRSSGTSKSRFTNSLTARRISLFAKH